MILEILGQAVGSLIGIVLLTAMVIAVAPFAVFIGFLSLEISMAFYNWVFGLWNLRVFINLCNKVKMHAERGREGTFPFFKRFYGGSWRFFLTMGGEVRDFIEERRQAR